MAAYHNIKKNANGTYSGYIGYDRIIGGSKEIKVAPTTREGKKIIVDNIYEIIDTVKALSRLNHKNPDVYGVGSWKMCVNDNGRHEYYFGNPLCVRVEIVEGNEIVISA